MFPVPAKQHRRILTPVLNITEHLQFSETPYDIEKGTHPLTADEAKTINNYKFTYDNSGRLLSVEFVRNNVLLDYSSMQGAAKITYELY